MKKWYRSCELALVAAMALQLSGCAQQRTWLNAGLTQQRAWLASYPGSGSAEQKLAKIEGPGPVLTPAGAVESTEVTACDCKNGACDSKLAQATPSTRKASQIEAVSAKVTAANPDAKKTPELLDANSEFFESITELEPEADLTPTPAEITPSAVRSDQTKLVQKSSTNSQALPVQEAAHQPEFYTDELNGLADFEVEAEKPSPKVEVKRAIPTAQAPASTGARTANRSTDSAPRKIDVRKFTPAPVSPVAAVESSSSPTDLLSLCPDAKGDLRQQIRSLNTKNVEVLKHRIGRIGTDPAAAPAMEQLLKHNDGLVRMHAAFALARMQKSTPEGVRIVVNGLKSSDPAQRSFAAATIAEMGPQLGDALEAFAESLDNRNHDGSFRFEDAEVLIRVKPRSQGANSAPPARFLVPSDTASDAPGYSTLSEPGELTEPAEVEEETVTPMDETIELESEASLTESGLTVVKQRVRNPIAPASRTFSVVNPK